MPDDVNAQKSIFAEIAKKVAVEIEAPAEPKIKRSIVERYAKLLAENGYEINADSVGMLADYLKGYNLWVCGNVGVGKTYFFDSINKIRKNLGYGPIYKLSMLETQGMKMEDVSEWLEYRVGSDILLDDVGAEPEMVSYGMKAEVFPYILEMRMKISGRRTHITSNLGPADILKRYDRRVSDRFVQFFKMEQIKARKSKRTLAPWNPSKSGEGML